MYMSSCARLNTLMEGKPVMKCSLHISISAVQSTYSRSSSSMSSVQLLFG
jgi:hypothetical protein